MLEARDITLKFGGVTALANISIDIGHQELVALIGPNGAGKSSLLNVLSGFYRPSEGTVRFEGKNIGRWPVHLVAQAGLARTFQGTHLLPHMSVLDNIMVGRYMHMKSSLTTAFFYYPFAHREELAHRAVAEDILSFLELEHLRHHPVGTLGYGMRKRVDLGRALAMEPRMLLLDEPMAGMNVEEKEDLARFILDIRESRQIPVVLVEHDMGVVMDIADRVIVLNFGRKIADARPTGDCRLSGGARMSADSLTPQTLPQWLLHNAAKHPDEVAQRYKRDGIWQEFSWADVRDEVRELALGLRARGVQRSQTVVLMSENRPELYWAEWAAQAIGAKVVALYPDATEAEVDYVLKDAQAVCVFAEDQEQVDKVLPLMSRHAGMHTVVWRESGGL
eukprot:gene9464-19656_t